MDQENKEHIEQEQEQEQEQQEPEQQTNEGDQFNETHRTIAEHINNVFNGQYYNDAMNYKNQMEQYQQQIQQYQQQIKQLKHPNSFLDQGKQYLN